ncbi:hypothetical protein PCYB_006040, partial [Plasmodium cynomolgi strain B]
YYEGEENILISLFKDDSDLACSYDGIYNCELLEKDVFEESNILERYRTKLKSNLKLIIDEVNEEGEEHVLGNNKVLCKKFSEFFDLLNDIIRKRLPDCEFKIKNLCDLIFLKRAYDSYFFSDVCEYPEKKKAQIPNSSYCKYINDSNIIYSSYFDICEHEDSNEVCKEFNEFEEFVDLDVFDEFEEFKKYMLLYINYEHLGKSEHNKEDVFEISCNMGSTSASYPHKGIYIYYHY